MRRVSAKSRKICPTASVDMVNEIIILMLSFELKYVDPDLRCNGIAVSAALPVVSRGNQSQG
jgi:hypothetical protein